MRIGGAGRLFFAIGLAGFGILQFVYGDFVPGRAPAWPPAIPGRLVWAFASGAILIGAGAAIASGARARSAALASGTMIFLWALLRHLPGLVANPHGITLTASGKALALSGGAFAVAGSLPVNRRSFEDAWFLVPGSMLSRRLHDAGRDSALHLPRLRGDAHPGMDSRPPILGVSCRRRSDRRRRRSHLSANGAPGWRL